jgi:serine/threonine protein kinase
MPRSRPPTDPCPRPDIKVGDVVDGRYELRRDLGHGAVGHVFEALHRFTGRSVAVKVVAPEAAATLAARDELAARLRLEARALASARHPGVVDVLDGGELPDGTPYFVMEMLEGRTLEGVIATRSKLPVAEAVALGLSLAEALGAAHAVDIVHRDVQPSNVLIVFDHARREVVKLIDFGIARVSARTGDKLTGIGAVIGTPAYMSPEQLLGLDDVDARSDVYSLGITLFECLTGRMPYEGSYQQVILDVCSTDPAPAVEAVEPSVPAPLAAVVNRATSKDRDARFSSMAELADALRAASPDAREHTELFGRPPPRGAAAAPAGRRKLPRAPYVTPVRIVMGDLTVDGRTEDISIGGMLVVCHQVCPTDRRATIRFALPVEGKVVAADVEVRWVRAARANDPEGPRALGVEFVHPGPDVVASIAKYVGFMMPPEPTK